MKHNRYRFIILCGIVGAAVVGCTDGAGSGGSAGTADGPSAGTAVSTGPSADSSDLFPGDRAVSVAKFWKDNPDIAPDFLDDAVELLDVEGVGPSTVDMEISSNPNAYVLVLTCDSAQEYRVSLQDKSRNELSWTGGNSCGGPAVGIYTTPILSTPPAYVIVDVPEGTETVLTVFATHP